MAAFSGFSDITNYALTWAEKEINTFIVEHPRLYDERSGLTLDEQKAKDNAAEEDLKKRIEEVRDKLVPADERKGFEAAAHVLFGKARKAWSQSQQPFINEEKMGARFCTSHADRNGDMLKDAKVLQLSIFARRNMLKKDEAHLTEQIKEQAKIISDGLRMESARLGAASTGLPELTPEQAADKAMAELLMGESKAKQTKPKKKGKGKNAVKAGSEVSESVPVAQASGAPTQKQKKGREAVAIAAAAPAPSFDGVMRQRQFDKRLSFNHPLHPRVKRWITGDLKKIKNEFGPTYAVLNEKGLNETLRRHEGGPLARLLGKDNEGVLWWRTENGAAKNSAAMLVQSTRTKDNEDDLPLNVLGILNFAFDEKNIVFHAYFVPIDLDKLFSYDEIIRGRIGDLEEEMRRMEEDVALETEAERDLLPEEEWNVVGDRQFEFQKDGSCVCTFKHTRNKMKVIPIGS